MLRKWVLSGLQVLGQRPWICHCTHVVLISAPPSSQRRRDAAITIPLLHKHSVLCISYILCWFKVRTKSLVKLHFKVLNPISFSLFQWTTSLGTREECVFGWRGIKVYWIKESAKLCGSFPSHLVKFLREIPLSKEDWKLHNVALPILLVNCTSP